jgi:hypothetical protein
MADVASRAVERPRERGRRENAFQWLKQTPAWTRALEHWGFTADSRWPNADHRPDLRPPAGLGLADFPHIYTVTWESGAFLLCVNADGTRCAIIDLVEELSRLWAASARPRAGRPRTANPSARTLRRWEHERRQRAAPTNDTKGDE